MRLRNKKTGKVIEWFNNTDGILPTSLAELNAEWEDYEEPKGIQWVDVLGANDGRVVIQYSNEKEAEKAVEKLKAWKRLKDKGFRFSGFSYTELCDYARVNIKATMINDSINKDLELLFGGEE